MSTIISFQTKDNGILVVPTSQQRKLGMSKLGSELRTFTNTATTLNPNTYAEGLAKALQAVIDGAPPAEEYELIFQETHTGPSFKITKAKPDGATVKCDLDGEPNQLIINVRVDPPDDAAKRMEAVFPRPEQRNSYLYVGDAADDINELSDLEAWDYLMAFKFLGRCK